MWVLFLASQSASPTELSQMVNLGKSSHIVCDYELFTRRNTVLPNNKRNEIELLDDII